MAEGGIFSGDLPLERGGEENSRFYESEQNSIDNKSNDNFFDNETNASDNETAK